MNSRVTHIENERLNTWLLKITCVYWLVVKLMGWRMFTANRLFPTAPVFAWLDQVPSVVHFILFLLSLLLISLAFFFPKHKLVLIALLAIEICSCLLDQNRWHPWEYQCIFTVFIFLANRNRQASIIPVFTFMLASTYFFSGCHKLNEGFLQNVWNSMLLRTFFKLAVARHSLLYYSGYISALLELAAGAALLFVKTQKIAARFLIMMHLFVLVWLGPLGLNYNKIIWPWNVAMILYLYLLFIKTRENTHYVKDVLSGWNKLVVLCWGILPVLGLIGYWDAYLSSGVYSGKSPYMIICIGKPEKAVELKGFYSRGGSKFCNGGATIHLQDWAADETNVFPIPEIRVYKQIQKKLEKDYAAAGLRCYIFANGKQQ